MSRACVHSERAKTLALHNSDATRHDIICYLLFVPHAQFPMPNSQFPITSNLSYHTIWT